MYQGLLDTRRQPDHVNRTALAAIRADTAAVLGKPFWNTPWFSGTPGMRDVVREAFATVLQGKPVRTELQLNLAGRRAHHRLCDAADLRRVRHRDRRGAGSGRHHRAQARARKRCASRRRWRRSGNSPAASRTTSTTCSRSFARRPISCAAAISRMSAAAAMSMPFPKPSTAPRSSPAQLLAFARRQPLKPQIFNVGAQIESIAQLIRPVVGSSIQITIDDCAIRRRPVCARRHRPVRDRDSSTSPSTRATRCTAKAAAHDHGGTGRRRPAVARRASRARAPSSLSRSPTPAPASAGPARRDL